MNKKRPVNLDLGTMTFPPMAISSILHRISGVVTFILLPVMIYFLRESLVSQQAFIQLQITLSHPFTKILLWSFCTALSFHLLAGIRHMIMDLGFGEEVHAGRKTSLAVIFLAAIAALLLGVWIW